MPKRKYKDFNFNETHKSIIDKAIETIIEYQAQGYNLTLRQLYYRFVAQDLFPASWADASTGSTNNEKSYKKVGDIIANSRLAGLIDWNAIIDRTRELAGNSHWKNPSDIVASCARDFKLDKWTTQPKRVEVWVEKDALEGIIGKVARELDIDFFSCRGYTSMTAIWDAGQRLKRYAQDGQTPIILHLGDHDPSGIDMSRDIQERIALFMDGYGDQLEFERIALNMPQVEEYQPPPNPAKITDSRFTKYQEEHGDESWELDALDPTVIDRLIRERVLSHREESEFETRLDEENEHRSNLRKAARNWNGKVARLLEKLTDPGE